MYVAFSAQNKKELQKAERFQISPQKLLLLTWTIKTMRKHSLVATDESFLAQLDLTDEAMANLQSGSSVIPHFVFTLQHV